MTKPPLENIGALKLALTNIRTYQEVIETDVKLYRDLDDLMNGIQGIIDEAEAEGSE